MAVPRYLTKSRFVLALECPTKLFYTGKAEYADHKKDDPFLSALAEGGFQVGELAKLYFPGGREIETLRHDQALEQTRELLERESVTLYEAAVRHRNLFVRADILIKSGSTLELIEVKSKSFRGSGPQDLLNQDGTIPPAWRPYLYDVAFQKHVLSLAFPGMEIRSHLLLADKNARATVDGLNQRFLICKHGNRTRVKVREGTTPETLGDPILTRVPVDEIAALIYAGRDGSIQTGSVQDGSGRDLPFGRWVDYLAEQYRQDRKIAAELGSKCGRCEFRCTAEELRAGLKSGFRECWLERSGLREEDLAEPLVIDLWKSNQRDRFIREGIYRLRDLDPGLLQPRSRAGASRTAPGGAEARPGLSQAERRRLQVEKARSSDPSPYFDAGGMKEQMRRWVYPLHFIDFETTQVAIPFNRGMAPYEGIAFQFSHHRVDADGRIAHAGQYLHTERGRFPSFAFLRALKRELEQDQGTIFRYAAHENTYLNIIYRQLREGEVGEVPDREELCRWITTVAAPTQRNEGCWVPGRRNMVDQLDLVQRYFYHPATGGSNSLKKVLPAVLGSSEYLQRKYSRPIYGRGLEIPSLNFEAWTWIRCDETGAPIDPYRLLPPIFEGAEEDDLEHLISDEHLADGAAAMIAYARMQFSEMGEAERQAIRQALLKYCELDTLAMVMLWEYWSRELMAG
ncbi:MAG: DUF2779 domain-containing protein [Spirochaetales bacterium]|nr:DUF2779 domain-containing protein [Spirochaetales bacterium]